MGEEGRVQPACIVTVVVVVDVGVVVLTTINRGFFIVFALPTAICLFLWRDLFHFVSDRE